MAELSPPTASPLIGSTHKRRRLLTVTDGNGAVVVEAKLHKEAKPAEAIFTVAGGEYRIERLETREHAVIAPDGSPAARYRKKEIGLAGGDVLRWESSSFLRSRYRLGDDLWVAKPRWPPPLRGFRAEVSPAFLAREDRDLLAGIAAVLTQWGIETEATMDQIGSGG